MISLRFDHLRSTHPRRVPLRGIVWHHTGGKNGAAGVYATLRSRIGPRTPDGLSVHYVIDAKGVVTQMASHSLVCLHAGIANEWTIGIEFVSPGFSGISYDLERQRGIKREEYETKIRGKTVHLLNFTEEQWSAGAELTERLCDELKIAKAVPIESDGSLMTRQMTSSEVSHYQGVLAHYHVHSTKLDCGTRPLERLKARWGG